MGAAVGVLVLFLIIIIVSASKGGGGVGKYNSLLNRGIPGRGILLGVSSFAAGKVGIGLNKYQQRAVTMDVEIPGRPPYEVSVTVLVPLNLVRDVLPGATVEVRVDPRDPTQIAIVGPGVGFNSSLLLTSGQGNS